MPELAVVEKLQPCLLDRLTDDEPNNPQESRAQRVITLQRYRQGVLRDLQWLLSASAHLPQEGAAAGHIEDFPDANRSVKFWDAPFIRGDDAEHARAGAAVDGSVVRI